MHSPKFHLLLMTLLAFFPFMKAEAAPPAHRVDVATAYTWVSVGDWQQITGGYTHSWSSFTTGLSSRVLRREFTQDNPVDLSVQLPMYFNGEIVSLEMIGEWSPSPTFVPKYMLHLSPTIRFLSFATHFTYRFAQYQNGYAQILTPGFSWQPRSLPWRLGLFVYLTSPEFGPILISPQLRVEYLLSYFWRVELWTTTGYETLNDRFVDPARQAPQLSLYGQVKHLFNDYSGLTLGLVWTHFFPETEIMAEERFNQPRLELSLRSFLRF